MNARTVAKMWQESLFPGKTLPDICIDLRQSLNGAADPWPIQDIKNVEKLLRAIIETWDDNSSPDKDFERLFDNSVLNIIKATIQMLNFYAENR